MRPKGTGRDTTRSCVAQKQRATLILFFKLFFVVILNDLGFAVSSFQNLFKDFLVVWGPTVFQSTSDTDSSLVRSCHVSVSGLHSTPNQIVKKKRRKKLIIKKISTNLISNLNECN